MTRTDLETATIQVMKTIRKGDVYTVNKLSEETHLNFRTVQKVLRLIEQCQKELETKKFSMTLDKNLTSIQMKPRGGMTSLPDEIQKMLIRTTYFPTPSRDEELLVFLLQKNAISADSAIHLDSSDILQKLLDAQHIKKTRRKYHLTEMGEITASGIVSLYPEITTS